MKEHKKGIYLKGLVPGKSAAPFHGFFLQLLAKGIPELSVETNEAKNIGSDKLLVKYIVVKIGQVDIGHGICGLAIPSNAAWAGIHFK